MCMVADPQLEWRLVFPAWLHGPLPHDGFAHKRIVLREVLEEHFDERVCAPPRHDGP